MHGAAGDTWLSIAHHLCWPERAACALEKGDHGGMRNMAACPERNGGESSVSVAAPSQALGMVAVMSRRNIMAVCCICWRHRDGDLNNYHRAWALALRRAFIAIIYGPASRN